MQSLQQSKRQKTRHDNLRTAEANATNKFRDLPDDVFGHVMEYLHLPNNSNDDLSLAAVDHHLRERIEVTSKQILLQALSVARPKVDDEEEALTTLRCHMLIRHAKQWRRPTLPDRLCVRYLTTTPVCCHGMMEAHSPQTVCALPDGNIASVSAIFNGDGLIRIFHPQTWETIASCAHTLLVVMSTYRLYYCKAGQQDDHDSNIHYYIILHVDPWEILGSEESQIIAWKWDGTTLRHHFTRNFTGLVAVAVAPEDGIIYYASPQDTHWLHAFRITKPNQAFLSVQQNWGSIYIKGGDNCGMVVVGNFLVIGIISPRSNGTADGRGIRILSRTTLQQCHFIPGKLCTDPRLVASSIKGVFALYGRFSNQKGLHVMSISDENGAIQVTQQCLKEIDNGSEDWLLPYEISGSKVYAQAGRNMHVYDLDAGGRHIRILTTRLRSGERGSSISFKGLAVTRDGLFLFLNKYEYSPSEDAEVQRYAP